QARVKWPNDVLVDGRKLAGILVEGRPQERWAVLGIGLNVAVREDQFPPELRSRAGTRGLGRDAVEPTLQALLERLERWRRAMVRAVGPVAGRRLLDVASGTGLVAAELVRAGASEVVGLDQSQEMLAGARARLARQPELARRVTLVRGEAERLPFAESS